MSKQSNILLITSDQQRADCNGFENPRIRTPHLDRPAGTRKPRRRSPTNGRYNGENRPSAKVESAI
jgi:hypothetical protein